MRLKKDASKDKLRGGYYTPELLAEFVVNWTFQNITIDRVLEPSCGDGVFLKKLLKKNEIYDFECTAIEITEIEANKAKNVVKENKQFRVINDDFYKLYENRLKEERFQAIVGNPPYIRYQYLSESQREEQSLILTSNNMKSNKLINAWVSFVVSCIQMMDENSRIGFVIPAELLQVGYAEDLRKFLMRMLQRVTIVTFKELVFEGVEQEVVLLLGEKDINHNQVHQLRIVQYENVNELVRNDDIENHEFFDVEINESKWTQYFLTGNDIQLINGIRLNDRFVRFSDVASVVVGITTGNNDYFCVDSQLVEEYDLENVCRPLIARSVNINGVIFTREDWQGNIDRGAKTYLIDFPEISYKDYLEGHKRYIEYGEESEKNTGYKCRIRDRWYRVPSIWVPNAFFLRRNYLYPKFMLNSQEVNAVSTDTMHRVTFNKEGSSKRVLLSYYNSIALAFTEIEGRSYGGGVLEILPGEVSKIMLPDLRDIQLIDDNTVDELVSIIDDYVRENDDILGILDEIDRRVLIDILGINEEIVLAFRQMWITLRERRLARGRR